VSQLAHELVDDLVAANRILAQHGVLDGYGHVSVRSGPGRYLLSRMLAPELVTAADIMELDLESRPVGDDGRKSYSERFIHGEIYKRRPEINAVVHNHSPALIPFGVTDVKLQPIYHMAGFVAEGLPTFEISDVQKDSDLMIRTPYLGQVLAKTLGRAPGALMRGHGCVVVGEDLPRAVGRSIYLELNAKLQMQAMGIAGREGKVRYLGEGEVAAVLPALDYQRAWELWRSKT
jgi:ribulose-5-phosphate 4-epimerase/fuculose-1-phosphate aldolase